MTTRPMNRPTTRHPDQEPIPTERGTLYTLGYGQPGAATQLDRLMREKQILLLDVRLVPHSRWDAGWNRAALAARYGERYRWEPHLGNLRYGERSSAIALATGYQEAIREAAQLLCHGTSLILLCVGAKARGCHRLLVAKLIQEALPGRASQGEARRRAQTVRSNDRPSKEEKPWSTDV